MPVPPSQSRRRIVRSRTTVEDAKQAAFEAVAEYRSINAYTVGRAVEAAAPVLARDQLRLLEDCLALLERLAQTAPDWVATEPDPLVVPNAAKLAALDLVARRAS